MHGHHVFNCPCWESLDMTTNAKKVMKTPIAKNFVIVMATSRQLLEDYLLKSNCEGHHLACSSLEVVMDNFSTLASPNYHNFVSSSKHFIHSGMGMMIVLWRLRSFGFQVHSRYHVLVAIQRQNTCLQNVSRPSKEWCGSREMYAGWWGHGKIVDHVWQCQMFEGLDHLHMSCIRWQIL